MAASVLDATDAGAWFPAGVDGVQPFRVVVTVPTTSIDDAGDDILLIYFPPNYYLDTDSLAIEPSDMDTGTALAWEIGLGDSDGVIDTSLITTVTSPSTGTRMAADADLDKFVDAGGKYLIATTITAATTAAAGTVGVEGYVCPGLVSRTAS